MSSTKPNLAPAFLAIQNGRTVSRSALRTELMIWGSRERRKSSTRSAEVSVCVCTNRCEEKRDRKVETRASINLDHPTALLEHFALDFRLKSQQ